MLSFKEFRSKLFESRLISEAKPIVSSGPKAERHLRQYVTPYLPGGAMHSKEGTHELRVDLPGAPAGTKVPLMKHKVVDGVNHVAVKAAGKQHIIPVSKLSKPVGNKIERNKGNLFERQFTEHLKKHGLMVGEGAGSTAGHDFHLINKKKETTHPGKLAEESDVEESAAPTLAGETKRSLHAIWGQTGAHFDPTKGWHVSPNSAEKRPSVAKHIEKEGVLKFMTKHFPKGIKPGQKVQLRTADTGIDHVHAYLKDHGVDVLHVGGGKHGTYRGGLSEHTDRTGAGLPLPKGRGHYEVRNKEGGKNLTIEFRVSHLDPSDTDLEKEEHVKRIKKALGHEV